MSRVMDCYVQAMVMLERRPHRDLPPPVGSSGGNPHRPRVICSAVNHMRKRFLNRVSVSVFGRKR